MLNSDQKYRAMDELSSFESINKTNKKVKDSLWNLQIQIDDVNTERLIEITKKNGWPSQEKFNCEPKILPMIIFRHSQEKYFKVISKLIESEFTDRRMKFGDYKIIKNYLNGRPKFN